MSAFQGFTGDTLQFFAELMANNNKAWFERNRNRYESQVKTPALEFISDMGEALGRIRPNIEAQPRVNGSLFRLNRDVRFSPDKSPYKTHIGILLWEGSRKRMENSGFYFHLEPDRILIGAGLYVMPGYLLKSFRDAVSSPKLGVRLVKLVEQLEEDGYIVGTEHYKRTPRDYDPQIAAARFLRFNGLSAIIEMPVPDLVFTADIIPFVLSHFKAMMPLHLWLLEALG